MAHTAPVIFGLRGTALSEEEGAFFHAARPWGVILFARNIESREQIRRLTDELREQSGNAHLPILIDQEGGRVARLKPPLVSAYPPMGVYGEIYKQDPARAVEAARLGAALIAQDCHQLGITVDCAPCLDLLLPETTDAIGDRALGDNVEQVVALGRAVIDGLEMGGVLPVIKHIPGHGRGATDSHDELPIVDAAAADLSTTDFEIFRQLNHVCLGMTGHLQYPAIDAQVSTFSKTLIDDVIRGQIGFDGVLMSDDISMQALSGSMQERVTKSLKAGCDLILHCNGDRAEMEAIAEALPGKPSVDAATRLARADAAIKALSCEVPAGARKVWGELLGDLFPQAQNAL